MVTAAFLGDSYVVGAGVRPRPLARYLGFAALASRKLRWEATYFSQGATGYANNGHLRDASYKAFPERVVDVVSAQPNIIIVAGGLNDQFHPDETGPAAVRTYTLIRDLAPQARLVVIGAFNPYPAAPAGMNEASSAIRDAATAAADDFFDPQELGWLPQAGVSRDGIHPTRSGHRSIARGFVAAMNSRAASSANR